MESQQNLSKLESILFFSLRFIALAAVTIALIGILIISYNLLRSQDVHVGLSDINTNGSATNVIEASVTPEKEVHIPESVTRHLYDDNKRILEDWLGGISGHEKKQDFIDNLSEVIQDAELNKVDVLNAINNYRIIKLKKLNKSSIEEYEGMALKGVAYLSIFAFIVFISIMSLILVMLAIERNTRR